MRVTTPEFIKSYGTLAYKALTEPVTITKNDRDRRAILLEELTEEDIAAIAASEMDPRHDHGVWGATERKTYVRVRV